MTRVHAAKQLLALGPLSFREFVQITGWPYRVCRGTISYMQQSGRAVFDGSWRLA